MSLCSILLIRVSNLSRALSISSHWFFGNVGDSNEVTLVNELESWASVVSVFAISDLLEIAMILSAIVARTCNELPSEAAKIA